MEKPICGKDGNKKVFDISVKDEEEDYKFQANIYVKNVNDLGILDIEKKDYYTIYTPKIKSSALEKDKSKLVLMLERNLGLTISNGGDPVISVLYDFVNPYRNT